MKIRKVTALIDTTGNDISGHEVQMLVGTSHLVCEKDVEFFLAHPDTFTVSAAYATVEDFLAAEHALMASSPLVGTTLTLTGDVILASDVRIMVGAGVPVDYTDGTPPATGETTAGKGSLYADVTNGKLYINGGTKAQPIWKIVTSAV